MSNPPGDRTPTYSAPAASLPDEHAVLRHEVTTRAELVLREADENRWPARDLTALVDYLHLEVLRQIVDEEWLLFRPARHTADELARLRADHLELRLTIDELTQAAAGGQTLNPPGYPTTPNASGHWALREIGPVTVLTSTRRRPPRPPYAHEFCAPRTSAPLTFPGGSGRGPERGFCTNACPAAMVRAERTRMSVYRQPGYEPPVVGLDRVVRIPLSDVPGDGTISSRRLNNLQRVGLVAALMLR